MIASTSIPTTIQGSFSFYLHKADEELIRQYAGLADAVVVRGRSAPGLVRAMRSEGWSGPVLFDGAGYESKAPPLDAQAWLEMQRVANADRLLTTGKWIPWDADSSLFRSTVKTEYRLASKEQATVLLALDYRWLTKGLEATVDVLSSLDRPVALVLADSGDPLSHSAAVNGLLALTYNVPGLSLLRCDHGAIGGIAFGAAHGSIGLIPTYRHFVPPLKAVSAIPNDRSPRIFVWDLMDWFAAGNIAGWSTSRIRMSCRQSCCGGEPLSRFLDSRLVAEADRHNRTVLAMLANYVLDAPSTDRRRLFGQLCSKAVERYGTMGGLTMIIEPKSQLIQWAQFA